MDFANATSCASDNGTNLTMLILSQLQPSKYCDIRFCKYSKNHKQKESGNSAILDYSNSH